MQEGLRLSSLFNEATVKIYPIKPCHIYPLSACGTPSGQKKVKTILKSHKVRHFVRFSVKIKLDNYLFFIVVKSVLLLLCVFRQSEGDWQNQSPLIIY